MKFHFFIVSAIIAIFAIISPVSAQSVSATPDSVIGQITSSANESFAGGISGDGRLVVFESTGNLATENPRNADGNREVFIFDYAQRRIFQITNTKSLLTDTTKSSTFDNLKVEILSIRPVMSNDGQWIAFGSNATIAYPAGTSLPEIRSSTNPGNFDANAFTNSTGGNSLTNDGNTEIWLYRIPAVAPANLSSGGEIPLTDLSAGTFTQVTNSVPSRLPAAGSTTVAPSVADDNREVTINADGNAVAFVSTRNLAPNGTFENGSTGNNNDEIFSYTRGANKITQITLTPRGAISAPIFNTNPSISGNGLRVAFASNADKPVPRTDKSNTDNNVEVFYTDLNADGSIDAARTPRQITETTRQTAGQIVNIFSLGRRMSLDGRYIVLDSYASDLNAVNGANQSSFALYLYDTTTSLFRQIGARSDADAAASGGDLQHFAGFTNYAAGITNAPNTLVFETRLNIKSDGTVAATSTDGLNQDAARPTQIYSLDLTTSGLPTAGLFRRLTTFPAPSFFQASTQPIPSNSVQRMTFTLGLTDFGTGNPDLSNEAFYLLLPSVNPALSTSTLKFSTGASRIPVSALPVPTPTPGTTPTPTPTPQTPAAVFGVSPGMLAVVKFTSGTAIVSQTAIGSLSRRFTLPIELNGVSVTVNGAASGIKSVGSDEVVFVVPPAFQPPLAGTVYPIVVHNNGTVIRGSVTIVPARPDIFTTLATPGPGGRARILNVVNRVQIMEPFTVTSVRLRGGTRVATVLRLFLTGVNTDVPASAISVRVGSVDITSSAIAAPVLREPGVYSIDITLPSTLNRAGDQPVIVTVTAAGQTFQSRLDDTAPRFRIL